MGEPIEQGSLTVNRRFVHMNIGGGDILVLQVQKKDWVNGSTHVLGRWRTTWQWAKPSDITSAETVIGLSDT